MSAIIGTFVKVSTMADGTPRITLDLSCTLSEAAALGLTPGNAFALARMTQEATTQAAQQKTIEKPKGGPLARLAGQWANDLNFQRWIKFVFVPSNPRNVGLDEAEIIRFSCSIKSRAELDSNERAARKFERFFRTPYMAWLKENGL